MSSEQSRYGVYIGNIDRSVTIEMLKQVFCQCGTILDCSLNGREADPYRFGFIDFATEDDRARAVKYNGFTLVGRKLRVSNSKGNVGKPEGFNNTGNAGAGRPAHSSGAAPQTSQAPPTTPGGLTQQQQIEAQVLLRHVEQGTMDIRQLSPTEQQLLMTLLAQNRGQPLPPPAPVAVPPPMQQPMPMMMPPMQGGYPPMMPMQGWGMQMDPTQAMYGGGMGRQGRGAGHARESANPPPSEELLRLRSKQREQYFDVVRKEAEKYAAKVQKRSAEGAALKMSDESSASDNEGKPSKKSKNEAS